MNNALARKCALELAGAYPGRGIDDTTIAQYVAALEPEDPEVGVYAIGDLVLAFPERPPTLGQLREALRLRRRQPELTAFEEIGYSHRTTADDVDHWLHGMYHLTELLAIPKAERTEEMRRIAQYPDTCPCPKRSHHAGPEGVLADLGKVP